MAVDRLVPNLDCLDNGKAWLEIPGNLDDASQRALKKAPKYAGVVNVTVTGIFYAGGTYGHQNGYRYKIVASKLNDVAVILKGMKPLEKEMAAEKKWACGGSSPLSSNYPVSGKVDKRPDFDRYRDLTMRFMRHRTFLAAVVVCYLALIAQSYAADTRADRNIQSAVRRLYSGAESVRSQAVKELVSHGVSAIPAVKRVLCNRSAKGFEVAWPAAVKVAGELKAQETVPCLLPLLAWDIPPGIGAVSMKSNETLISVDPAFDALLRIGEPAVPTIRHYLPMLHPTQVDMAMRILQTIGSPAAKEAAEHYLTFLENEVERTKRQISEFPQEAAQ